MFTKAAQLRDNTFSIFKIYKQSICVSIFLTKKRNTFIISFHINRQNVMWQTEIIGEKGKILRDDEFQIDLLWCACVWGNEVCETHLKSDFRAWTWVHCIVSTTKFIMSFEIKASNDSSCLKIRSCFHVAKKCVFQYQTSLWFCIPNGRDRWKEWKAMNSHFNILNYDDELMRGVLWLLRNDWVNPWVMHLPSKA